MHEPMEYQNQAVMVYQNQANNRQGIQVGIDCVLLLVGHQDDRVPMFGSAVHAPMYIKCQLGMRLWNTTSRNLSLLNKLIYLIQKLQQCHYDHTKGSN